MAKSTSKPRARRPTAPAAPPERGPVWQEGSAISDQDLYLFNEGNHLRLWERLGSHLMEVDGTPGVRFAVWAPNAGTVSVVGDFNDWDPGRHHLSRRGSSGIWEGFIPGVARGQAYKYRIDTPGGYGADKADPYAAYAEEAPRTASRVWSLEYDWGDSEWMRDRAGKNALDAPMSVYEMHLGSWRRPGDPAAHLSYREMAPLLVEYLQHMGFTHVEFLPVMEHPFYGSWGYQTTGYYAPTSRYGSPQDFMFLVDQLHRHGIGVILDWVPSHFPTDEHGLGYFDGTHLYEHGDPRQGFHPDWNSFIFNYGRHEVRSFLLSNALYWLEVFHADGLRVDAVASMIYLDYSRKEGEWVPNIHGGRENLEALEFLRQCNREVYLHQPDTQTTAEESTAWPMVSRPLYVGGLGFGMKWDMGWMHDTLEYFAQDPVHRKYHHNKLTFRSMYAWTENFVLPLSHDEVVHGKGSLVGKMPGDEWQRFANLRLLFGYMYGQSGKKLLFMGGEIGQWREWNHDSSLDWHLLDAPAHAGLQRWMRDLNTFYRAQPALWQKDTDPAGFQWIDCNDTEQSTLTFLRHGENPADTLVFACNFTPVLRANYRIGVPRGGYWAEALNSDAELYGGSGQGNLGGVSTSPIEWHGQAQSINITLPPLGMLAFRAGEAPAD